MEKDNGRRLDILILGPMKERDGKPSSTRLLGEALDYLLASVDFKRILGQQDIVAHQVQIPENWDEQEIVRGILTRIDTADLVIVNLTPLGGPGSMPSPNVYYELGLLHALGLPVLLVYQQDTTLPFYLLTNRGYAVKDFSLEAILEVIETPLKKFLDPEDLTDFTDNRITQFYEGLPVVDISAAVGLATGYYYNFCGRLLRDGSFISTYPDKIRHLVIVRPDNIFHTYEQDHQRLIGVLKMAGYGLQTEKLDAPQGDGKGPLWIDQVDGIVVDLPRTIYPLKISPRLLAMQERLDKLNPATGSWQLRQNLLKRTGDKLLDRVEHISRYHVRKEHESYRASLLHFCRIDELPVLLKQLNAQ